VGKNTNEAKKRVDKVFLFTSLLNYLLGVEMFFLTFMGFPHMQSLGQSAQWAMVYKVVPVGFFISIFGFVMIIVSLVKTRVVTPETIAASKFSNKVLITISGLVLCLAIYETLVVAGIVR
jgi:hypothetical protein